jgi:hypothetical protein
MSAISLLTKIPWDKIVKYGPIIIDMAERIYDKLKDALGGKSQSASPKKGAKISVEALADRVKELEVNELQQAELVSNMARQSGELSEALQIISKRVLLLSILVALALLTSLVCIVLIVLK